MEFFLIILFFFLINQFLPVLLPPFSDKII